MKKLSIIIVILLTLTGCLYKTEISSNIIVDVVGIQYIDNKYKMYFSPFDKDEDIIVSNGTTVDDAIQNAQINKNKNIFLQQISTLIIDNSLYENNMYEIINNFSDPRKYNLQTDIYTTDNLSYLFSNDTLNSFSNSKYNKIIGYNKKHYILNKKMEEVLVKDFNKNKTSIPHIVLSDEEKVTIDKESFFYNGQYIKDIDMNDIIVKEILTKKIKNTFFTIEISKSETISLFIQKSSIKKENDTVNITLEIEKLPYDENKLINAIEINIKNSLKNNIDYIDSKIIKHNDNIKVKLIYP